MFRFLPVLAAFVAPVFSAASNEEVVNSLYKTFGENDVEGLLALFDDNLKYRSNLSDSMGFCVSSDNKDEMVEQCLSKIGLMLPEMTLTKKSSFSSGEDAFVHSQQCLPTVGCACFAQHLKIKDGKILEITDFMDTRFVEEALTRGNSGMSPRATIKLTYDLFAEGRMEEFSQMLHDDFKFYGSGPTGLPCDASEPKSREGFLGDCLAHIPATWPGFHLEPIHMLVEGSYVFVTLKATSDNGMNTFFGHRHKVVNGQMIEFRAFDDSMEMFKASKAKKEL